jgi:hypothetical protein
MEVERITRENNLINKFTDTIFEYIDGFESEEGIIIDGTLDEVLEDINSNNIYSTIKNGNTTEEITKTMIDKYIEEHFNSSISTNNPVSFYNWIGLLSDKGDLDTQYSSGEFLILLKNTAKCLFDECGAILDIQKDESIIWDTIAYFFVKEGGFGGVYETIYKRINSYLKELVCDEIKKEKTAKEYEGKSRFECVICYENKVIYTGCSNCNSAFLCFECYDKLPTCNECPLCRCGEMMINVFSCNCYKLKMSIKNPHKFKWHSKLERVVHQLGQKTTQQVQEEHIV